MFNDGLKRASSASAQKVIGIWSHLCGPSQVLLYGLVWFTLTLLALSLFPVVLLVYSHVLITRWPEAILITNVTAETVAQACVSSWIEHFGIPSTISTDRGHQFDSCLWNEVMQLLGSKRIRTTAYHPSSNGLVERFHRQLKA